MKLLEIRKKRWECCREEEMIIEKIENKGRKRIILRNSYNFVRSLWKIQFCYFFVRILFKPNMCIMVTIY